MSCLEHAERLRAVLSTYAFDLGEPRPRTRFGHVPLGLGLHREDEVQNENDDRQGNYSFTP